MTSLRPQTDRSPRLLAPALLALLLLSAPAPEARATPTGHAAAHRSVPPRGQQVRVKPRPGSQTRQIRPKVRSGSVVRLRKPGWFARTWAKLKPGKAKQTTQVKPGQGSAQQSGATAKPKPKTGEKKTVGLRQAWHAAREELQVYRGSGLERLSDRMTVGKSDFDPKLPVRDNLKKLVEKHDIPHYYAKVNGRDVLHVVVDLAAGKKTKQNLRQVLRRIGDQTIELNYKVASEKNRWGHVAVRVGGGALYDLTGTQGVAQLPPLAEKALKLVRGSGNLKFARRRSLRRFMESRRDSPHASASVYQGMLFSATPEEIKTTKAVYERRLGEVKEFNVNGGDGKKGIFSCAQFLTEEVPFLNQRGINRNIGAKSTASAARSSDKLEAVLVYKMPKVTQEQLQQFP